MSERRSIGTGGEVGTGWSAIIEEAVQSGIRVALTRTATLGRHSGRPTDLPPTRRGPYFASPIVTYAVPHRIETSRRLARLETSRRLARRTRRYRSNAGQPFTESAWDDGGAAAGTVIRYGLNALIDVVVSVVTARRARRVCCSVRARGDRDQVVMSDIDTTITSSHAVVRCALSQAAMPPASSPAGMPARCRTLAAIDDR